MKFKDSVRSVALFLGMMVLWQGVALADEGEPTRKAEDLIPDSVLIAIWSNDVAGMKEGFESNPYLAALLEDEDIEDGEDFFRETLLGLPGSVSSPHVHVFHAFFNDLDLFSHDEEEDIKLLEYTPAEIAETFSGVFLSYLTRFDNLDADGMEVPDFDDVLVASFAEDEREKVEAYLEEMLRNTPDSATRRTITLHDEEVFQIQYPYVDREEFSGLYPYIQEAKRDRDAVIEYTFMDGYLLVGTGEGRPLEGAIATIKGLEGFQALSEASDYRRLVNAHGSSKDHARIYVNIEKFFDDFFDDNDEEDEEVFKILGLYESGPFLLGMHADHAGLRVGAALLTSREYPGLLGLLHRFPENSLDGLRLVPSDAPAFMSWSVDLGATYDFIMEQVREENPEVSGAIQIGLAVAQAHLGVNIVDDVIRQITGEFVSYERKAVDVIDGMDAEWSGGFSIPFNGTMETISRLNDGIRNYVEEDTSFFKATEDDIDGLTLWALEPSQMFPGEEERLHFSITPSGVFSGLGGLEVREMIRASQREGSGTDIRANADVQSILDGINPDRLLFFSFLNGRAFVDEYLRTADTVMDAYPESRMRRSIGDSWFSIHGSESTVRVGYMMKAPR